MNERAVGFVGLGRMGRGMALNLVRAGVPLAVYDVREEATAALGSAGARVASSLADLATGADLLFVCLPNAPDVATALFGEGGVCTSAGPGLHVVDYTTMNQAAALALGERVGAAGGTYNDCPVSGMPFRADEGTLTMMFGGAAAQFQQVRPYLEAMGSIVVHCGAVGAGQLMKAVNNIVYNVNIAAVCEVLPLAVKAGLDPERVAEVMTTGTSRSFASDYFVPRILDGRFDTDFSMAEAYKDIVNVQEVATRLAASTPVVNAMISTYQNAMAMGFGGEPKNAMIKVYERVLGLEVRRAGAGEPGD